MEGGGEGVRDAVLKREREPVDLIFTSSPLMLFYIVALAAAFRCRCIWVGRVVNHSSGHIRQVGNQGGYLWDPGHKVSSILLTRGLEHCLFFMLTRQAQQVSSKTEQECAFLCVHDPVWLTGR